MKKLFLFISSLFVIGCADYTVEIKQDNVKVNGTAVKNGDCLPFQTILWDFAGDFPIEIQIGEEDAKEYSPNNYAVADGKVTEVQESCEPKETADDPPAEDDSGDGEE